MPALDRYHESVRKALVKEGWDITDDPLIVPFGRRDVLIDLGAERMLAAERNGERIAVEIKSFLIINGKSGFIRTIPRKGSPTN